MSGTRPDALCVDLDGTLIFSDLLIESFLLLVKHNPVSLLLVPWWLMQGKARLKAEIAARVTLDGAALPYNHSLLAWLREEKDNGRSLWLCTAADHRLAQAVHAHLALFDGVLASDGRTNLAGTNKAKALVARFGDRGFDYCGNSTADLPVWSCAQGAIVVNARSGLVRKASTSTPVLHHFSRPALRPAVVLKALRWHQWAKNLLVFVPIIAAHQLTDPGAIANALLAFIAFGLCASAVYLINDLMDLQADRQHPSKRHRPFASGALSLTAGFMLVPALVLASFSLALFGLPKLFLVALTAYGLSTLAYTWWLKQRVIVDVLVLAALYTLRIAAGAAACAIPLSFWLLLFSIFLFLSLAMVKRYAELHGLKVAGQLGARGRGYLVDDLVLLQSLGTSSGCLSALVLALYLNSPDVVRMYTHPQLIWGLVLLVLYWVSRMWFLAHRGRMHEDPLVFALKDRTSLVVVLVAAAVLGAANAPWSMP